MAWTAEALALSGELKEMLEAERMASIEFNAFYENPKRHIKLTADSFEQLADLVVQLAAFEADFIAASMPPDDEAYIEPEDIPFEEPVSNGAGTGYKARSTAQAPVAVLPVRPVQNQRPSASQVKCGLCGGPVFDEHRSKFWGNGLGKSGNPKPGWKCKNEGGNCGGIAWDEYDVSNQWTRIGDWQHPRL